jgi:hypothetical protein
MVEEVQKKLQEEKFGFSQVRKLLVITFKVSKESVGNLILLIQVITMTLLQQIHKG